MEASPGIEPGCKDLQSSASPLRHEASLTKTDKRESLTICFLTDGCDTVRRSWRASNRKAEAPQDEFGKFQNKDFAIDLRPKTNASSASPRPEAYLGSDLTIL